MIMNRALHRDQSSTEKGQGSAWCHTRMSISTRCHCVHPLCAIHSCSLSLVIFCKFLFRRNNMKLHWIRNNNQIFSTLSSLRGPLSWRWHCTFSCHCILLSISSAQQDRTSFHTLPLYHQGKTIAPKSRYETSCFIWTLSWHLWLQHHPNTVLIYLLSECQYPCQTLWYPPAYQRATICGTYCYSTYRGTAVNHTIFPQRFRPSIS